MPSTKKKQKTCEQFKSLSDCNNRAIVIATIENIGLDSVFERCPRETAKPYDMLHHAWELLADGLGENKSHDYLLEELNHIAEHYSE